MAHKPSLALAWEPAVQWTARYPVFCLVSIAGNATDQERRKKGGPDLTPRHITADCSLTLRQLQYTSSVHTPCASFCCTTGGSEDGGEDVPQTEVSETRKVGWGVLPAVLRCDRVCKN